MFEITDYFLRAGRLARAPGMRRYIVLPLTFNIVLFGTLFWLAGSWLAGWIATLGAGWELSGWLAFVNGVIDAGLWILQAMAWLALLMLFASTFTIAVQLIAAPFMGLLAEQVDRRVASSPLPEESIGAMILRTFRRELRKTWDWLWRTALVGLLVLILSLIPLLNLLAPVVWFGWTGWLLGLQYLDYGADTRQVPFLTMKARARQHRGLILAFGAVVLVATMVPLVNLLVMPIAVITGVLIWQKVGAQGTSG